MTTPIPKCATCTQEISAGKYYELYDAKGKTGDYCSPCWIKDQTKYEPEIKKGLLKVVETEREREREREDPPLTNPCDKCQKKPRSGKPRKAGWNFCIECLKHPTAVGDNEKYKTSCVRCPWCKKIILWSKLEPKHVSLPASTGGIWDIVKDYKFEWKDKTAIQRWEEQIKNSKCGDVYCSDQCKSSCEEANREKCINCQKLCYRKELCPWFNKENSVDEMWCIRCLKETGKIEDDKNEKDKPNSNDLCERCHKEERYWTWFWHTTDFTKETHWFGENCPCLEQWKKERTRTCPQCKKTEFPDMDKGWLLDYEIKKAFCSPFCHVTYRELKWEEAQRLTRVEMVPPRLEISNPRHQPNFDWEKEGLRREVLFRRTYAKELEQRLNNQSNLTPEERQQSNYLRNLQRNTLNSAENNYQSRYGTLNEDGSDKGKGLSGGVIALLVVGGIALVVGIIFLLTRNKNKNK